MVLESAWTVYSTNTIEHSVRTENELIEQIRLIAIRAIKNFEFNRGKSSNWIKAFLNCLQWWTHTFRNQFYEVRDSGETRTRRAQKVIDD